MGKDKRFFNGKDQFIADALNKWKQLKDIISTISVS